MTLVSPKDYIQVGGLVQIFVAVPLLSYVAPQWPFNPVRASQELPGSIAGAYAALMKLGESADIIEPQKRNIMEGVKGDSYGGSSGGDIEKQSFGFEYDIQLDCTRWDPEVLAMIECLGGLHPGGDRVPLNTMGALIQRDRSFRLLLYPLIDPRFIYNFPCCVADQPRKIGEGTRHSRLSLSVTAVRAPEGHWATPATGMDLITGYVKNNDFTGYVP